MKFWFLVCEYASKGNLYGILHSNEDFLLELRLNIAVKTAEALAYLHTSAVGVIRHGYVKSSSILVDDNFMPKLSDFSFSMKVTKDKRSVYVIGDKNYIDQIYLSTRF